MFFLYVNGELLLIWSYQMGNWKLEETKRHSCVMKLSYECEITDFICSCLFYFFNFNKTENNINWFLHEDHNISTSKPRRPVCHMHSWISDDIWFIYTYTFIAVLVRLWKAIVAYEGTQVWRWLMKKQHSVFDGVCIL